MPKVPSKASIICGAVTSEPPAAAPKAKLGAVDAIAISGMNANRALRRNEDDFIAIDLSGDGRTIVPRAGRRNCSMRANTSHLDDGIGPPHDVLDLTRSNVKKPMVPRNTQLRTADRTVVIASEPRGWCDCLRSGQRRYRDCFLRHPANARIPRPPPAERANSPGFHRSPRG
jgi:hypothetical protein